MMNTPLYWHPRYSILEVTGMGAILISETDEFFISWSEYSSLNDIIKNHGKLSDYLFLESETVVQVERIQRIDQLFKQNILSKSEISETEYITRDLNCINTRMRIQNNVYVLSECLEQNKELLFTTCQTLNQLDSEIAWVLVDDYLDPNLIEINNHFIESQQTWCLLKLSGEQPCIGPVFKPNHIEPFACYECLKTRLVNSNPVREWHRRYKNEDYYVPYPSKIYAFETHNALEYLTDELYFDLTQDKNSFLSKWDSATGTWQNHPVTARPQCKKCGDNNKVPLIHSKIQLQPAPKNHDDDGGVRQLNRETTLKHLNQLVDPITGIISDIDKISGQDLPEELSVYRASYFQNSYLFKELTPDTFVQLSLGKGVSDTQARVSALGEAVERYAAQYNGEELIVLAKPKDLAHRYCLPEELTPFSQAQYASFEKMSSVSLQQPQWIKKYNHNESIHWVQGWSLTHSEHVYFPAAYCLANTPFEDHIYSLYNHNGNATGNNNEEAILQGALELIERDAAAIWWYNQIPRPQICPEIIPEDQLNIINNTLSKTWNYWILDISNNVGIVACVAVGQHKTTGKFVLGFGAHIIPSIAVTRALTEMYQLIVIKDKVSGPFNFNAIESLPYLFPKPNTTLLTQEDFPSVKNTCIRDDIFYVLELLKNQDLECCIFDYSRADIPFKTLKVIIPGLCHFWPQFGSHRLYETPVSQGWLSKAITEQDFNPIPLYL